MLNEEDLRFAIWEQDLDRCRRAIADGVDVDAVAGGWSMLHWACSVGNVEIVKLLIDAHADLSGKMAALSSPLMAASERGYAAVCQLLLDAGADPHLHNSKGETALLLAGAGHHWAVCAALTQSGVDVDSPEGKGRAAILHAALDGNAEFCRFLLDAGANIESVDYRNWSALFVAAAHGHVEVCRLLLDRGADAGARSDEAYGLITPFQLAVACGQASVVQHFIAERGEDPAQRTQAGRTMAQLGSRQPEVRALLRSAKTARLVRESVGPTSSEACEVNPALGSKNSFRPL